MLNRVLHKLLKLLFDVLETSNVVPSDVGHFDHGLSDG